MNTFEGKTTETSIDAMSVDELIEHLGNESGKFNDLKKSLDEMLGAHANGGDETTKKQISLILDEWGSQFKTIQSIYRKAAGIEEGQEDLL